MWPSLSNRNSNPPLITRQHYDTLEAKLKKKNNKLCQKKKIKSFDIDTYVFKWLYHDCHH